MKEPRWTERLRDLGRYLPLALGGAVVLRRFSHALGDNLMLTCLAREVRRALPAAKLVVETTRPDLFRRNPHVDLVTRTKVARTFWKPEYRIDETTTVHVLDQLMACLPIQLPAWERRLELYLDDREHQSIRRGLPADYIVLAPQGKGTVAANRKDWGVERFQALVDSMPGQAFVQVGVGDDRLLRGAIDLRGLDVPTSAFVVRAARVSILLEGGFMHVANAVGARAIVLFGGALRPEVTGYPDHLAVVARPACSPCFRSHGRLPPCEGMECMGCIAPEFVRGLIENRRYEEGGVVEAG